MPPTDSDTEAEEKTLTEVYKSLHAKIKFVAAHRGLKMAEALQQFGAPGIDRERKRIIRELNEEIGGES